MPARASAGRSPSRRRPRRRGSCRSARSPGHLPVAELDDPVTGLGNVLGVGDDDDGRVVAVAQLGEAGEDDLCCPVGARRQSSNRRLCQRRYAGSRQACDPDDALLSAEAHAYRPDIGATRRSPGLRWRASPTSPRASPLLRGAARSRRSRGRRARARGCRPGRRRRRSSPGTPRAPSRRSAQARSRRRESPRPRAYRVRRRGRAPCSCRCRRGRLSRPSPRPLSIRAECKAARGHRPGQARSKIRKTSVDQAPPIVLVLSVRPRGSLQPPEALDDHPIGVDVVDSRQ